MKITKEVLMKPHYLKDVSADNLIIFEKIKYLIENLPDIDLGKDEKGEVILLSCHMLARALAKIFDLKYVDGFFAGSYSHTWLLTPDQQCIIDPYPCGIIDGPILVIANERYIFTPASMLYKKSNDISKAIKFSSNDFRRSLRRVEKQLRIIQKSA